jgi:hypothetical protein
MNRNDAFIFAEVPSPLREVLLSLVNHRWSILSRAVFDPGIIWRIDAGP